MIIIFTGLSIFCLLYWIVLAIYQGLATSQSYIWLVFACAYGFAAFMDRLYRLSPKKVYLAISVVMHTCIIVWMAVLVVTQVLIYRAANSTSDISADYVIVLGAKVEKNKKPSRTLARRLDAAIDYLETYPNAKLVLSGGQGGNEPISEAVAMASYLTYNGISDESLYLEIQSRNTYENLVFSKALIDRVRIEERVQMADSPSENVLAAESRPIRIAILSDDYHLFRAMCIAQKNDLDDIIPIGAGYDPVLLLHSCVRESLAIIKDRLVGNL